jgi:redox-sensitive bicupin YhaK (pirin superfamily)
MSAGTGVTHSEFNPSRDERLHLLQIWILPERRGLEPEYEQKAFPAEGRRGKLQLFASHDGHGDSLRIHQDVAMYGAELPRGARLVHPLEPGRHAWVQVARGAVELNGTVLGPGDGAAISGERRLELAGRPEGEVLLFDLA